ncbi:MAG: hypothetical protein H6662_20060, partial [Ardenticatenaceae bacterium]|nr:hypothetical protein [Ardenticatenaceae bacterium]
ALLLDAPDASASESEAKQLSKRWEQETFLIQQWQALFERQDIDQAIFAQVQGKLEAELVQLEIKMGLRQPEPRPVVEVVAEETAVTDETAVPPTDTPPSPKPKRPKRQPLTWDRVWDTLLSERTLKAILFLGVILLIGSGISWVVWNWNTFPPIVQIAFLGSFTALFYALGWYVRVKMRLPDSGIALSAVASLLVPLDFVAFYISGGFPAGSWPQVWLAASIVCLLLYSVVALLLQAEFFGYLISIAAVSLSLALFNLPGAMAWWPLGVTAVSLPLALLHHLLPRGPQRTRFLSRPFIHAAVGTAVPAMLLSFGVSLFTPPAQAGFYYALAAAWWLGGLTMLLGVPYFRLPSLVWAMQLAFPAAVWFTQRVLFAVWRVPFGWHALGWALLAPFYLLAGWWLRRYEDDVVQGYGKTAVSIAALLITMSGFWSLTHVPAAAVVHPLLAAEMLGAALLWQQPRLLWLMSLFLVSGTGAWQGNRGAAPAELTLPWALLAILHLIAAKRADAEIRGGAQRFAEKEEKKEKGEADHAPRHPVTPAPLLLRSLAPQPLYGAAVAIAALAVLPALAFFDRPLLTYALGNWIGVNGWLAYLAHGERLAGLAQLLQHRRLQKLGAVWFHWLAALPLAGWVWLLVMENGRITIATTHYTYTRFAYWLPLLYAALAWGLLALALWLRQKRWEYGRPWQTAAHFANAAALYFLISDTDEAWGVAALFVMAGFYLTAVWLLHNPRHFYTGGVLLPAATVLLLIWLEAEPAIFPVALAAITCAYFLLPVRLSQLFAAPDRLTRPMYRMGKFMAMVATLFIFFAAFDYWNYGQQWLWVVAIAPLLLALGFAAYAWELRRVRWAHLSVWMATASGGVVVKLLSSGTGRSAVLVAALAIAYILLERRLHELVRQKGAAPFFREAWLLYRRPLTTAGWALSLATIGAALLRNVGIIGTRLSEFWAIVALLMITGLYAIAAPLYKKVPFVWFASLLFIAPWTLGTRWLFGDIALWHTASWLVCALVLLAAGGALAWRVGLGEWSWPPLLVAHGVALFALLAVLPDTAVGSVTLLLGSLFYVGATAVDHLFGPRPNARFLYPALGLLPLWAAYVLQWAAPAASWTAVGLLVLTFAWPLLIAGRRIRHWVAAYQWPFYWAAYGTAVAATLLILPDRPVLVGVLLFDALLAAASAAIFRQPLWLYAAAALLPLALGVAEWEFGWRDGWQMGWMLALTAWLYLGVSGLLHGRKLARYAIPLLVGVFVTAVLALPFSAFDRVGALVGFALVAGVLAWTAVWRRWPVVLSLATAVAIVPYAVAVDLLNVPFRDYGLAVWPGILAALLLARWLDGLWGIEPGADGRKFNAPFPWGDANAWAMALWLRLTRWWALPLYALAFGGAALSSLLALQVGGWRWAAVLALGTAVYFYGLARFRLRGWLLLAWGWLELTALALIRWAGLADSPTQLALAFVPMTALTLFAALLVQEVRGEGAVVAKVDGRWTMKLGGWSRPLFLLFFATLGVAQVLALFPGDEGALATLLHGLLLAVLASFWQLPLLAYAALATGWLVLTQALDVTSAGLPVAFAALAVGYGLVSYGLLLAKPEVKAGWRWLRVWERPLLFSGWVISSVALLLALGRGAGVVPVLMRALVAVPHLGVRQTALAAMLIRTFAVLGLFYLIATLIERRPRLSYLALWLLFSSWSFWLLLLAGARELQLYAIPAGLILLGMGWLEWVRGSRAIAPWLDRGAALLLLGSAFWQSFGDWGGVYALIMVVEGLLLVWLGSLRRLRRLLYAGVMGVVTAVAGQLVEPILALNTVVLLLLGALLVALGIGLERRLEKVRELSQEMRAKLERWE